MDISTESEEIKKELFDLIVKLLNENKIEINEAQNLAKDFLLALPAIDHQDLLKKLKELGEKHTDSNGIYLKALEKDSDSQRDQALNQMRDFISQGQIDPAIAAAKEHTEKQQA